MEDFFGLREKSPLQGRKTLWTGRKLPELIRPWRLYYSEAKKSLKLVRLRFFNYSVAENSEAPKIGGPESTVSLSSIKKSKRSTRTRAFQR